MKIQLDLGEYYGHGYKLAEPEETDLEDDEDGAIVNTAKKLSIRTFYLLWVEVSDPAVKEEEFDLDVFSWWEIKLVPLCKNVLHAPAVLKLAENGEGWRCGQTNAYVLGPGAKKEIMMQIGPYHDTCEKCRVYFLEALYNVGDGSKVTFRVPIYLTDLHYL